MKAITLIISMITFIVINGYSQDINVNDLLEKKETRTEIYNAILNNHEHMQDFMNSAKGNQHAMMMMNQNNQMMKQADNNEGKNKNQMMGHDQMMGMNKGDMMNSNNMEQNRNHMMNMMKDNPEMMQNMMANMMKMCDQDSTMSNKMAGVMSEHPKMMKMCMQKMKEKGMMGTDGKMKMMDMKVKSNESKHNH